MKPTYDLHVDKFVPLVAPETLKAELPMTDAASGTVLEGRETIQAILDRDDPRLLVVTGPCSIHDEEVALDYARRLAELREKVKDTMELVMRVYFEKPRTTVGWKGMINDPHLDGSCDIITGLRRARKLLLQITEMGMPTATEMLDPITPQYIAGLVCWAAIGARTIESQTHREMASGLSMPVGFKNCTDGGLDTAVNAMIAAGSPQSFLGIDQEGRSAVVKTTGNPYAHLVLRGGSRPNYDSVSVHEAIQQLHDKGLCESLTIDCSHSNSRKQYQGQTVVWQDVINQIMDGNDRITGMMLESNIHEGKQKNTGDRSTLEYGVSITDACISWETTEQLILSAHDQLLRQNGKEACVCGPGEAPRYKVA